VALVISSNFLSGFNGMQQRAAQLAAALGKQGFALHFISLGRLNSTEECSAAAPAMVCHGPGEYTAQYEGFLAWARRRRAAPSLLLLGFTSLTLELSRALLRLPASAFGRWRRGGYDPSHAPKAHRCLVMRDWARRDFPQAPHRPSHRPLHPTAPRAAPPLAPTRARLAHTAPRRNLPWPAFSAQAPPSCGKPSPLLTTPSSSSSSSPTTSTSSAHATY